MRLPLLKSLHIKRFRSIPAAEIVFDNPTFLVGQNGSGKSNLADAFEFFADAMRQPLQEAFDFRGGISVVRNKSSGTSYPPNLGLRASFGPLNGSIRSADYAFEVRATPNYGFEVQRERCIIFRKNGKKDWFDRNKGKFESSIEKLKPGIENSSLALPLVGGDETFSAVFRFLSGMRAYSIVPSQLREMQDPDSGLNLKKDGRNAASVIQEVRRQNVNDWERICEILETIVPNTKRVQAKKHGNKLSLEFTQEWGDRKKSKFEAFNMSDGTLRALGIIAAVFQNPKPSVLVIEEPEATIHPGALGSILDVIQTASKFMQVIVTTHSPDLLDAKWIRENHLRVVTWHEGASRVGRISESAKEAIKKHLMGAGELLRANALTGTPLFPKDAANKQSSLFDEIQA